MAIETAALRYTKEEGKSESGKHDRRMGDERARERDNNERKGERGRASHM